MKIPRRPIFFIGPCFLLDVARPHPAKTFDSHHVRDAPPVDPIQRTFRDFQRLVQSSDSQICFIESNPAIPDADERVFHSHFVTAVACPLNSHPRFSRCPNAVVSFRKSSTLKK